jgi:riboflavin synthase
VFTGLVEALGTLVRSVPLGGGSRLTLSHPGWREGLDPGASVAVDGCCLTVVESDSDSFAVEATRETLVRTRFGWLEDGAGVNLERPLKVGEHLGGHWLQGHVDGVLTVSQIERRRETCYLHVTVPAEALDWVVPQGSIALNGVSLTVLDVEREQARVAIIPHTWGLTNLSRLTAGARVNVEYDILAKYVTAALRRWTGAHAEGL